MDTKAALLALYNTQNDTVVEYDDPVLGTQKAPIWLIAKWGLEEIEEKEAFLERTRVELSKAHRKG
jgi:uncharacterized phage protein gp47/JayE